MDLATPECDFSPLLLTAGGYPEDGAWYFYTPAGTVEIELDGFSLESLLRLLDGTHVRSAILTQFAEPLRDRVHTLLSLLQEVGVVRPVSRLYTLYYDHTEQAGNQAPSARTLGTAADSRWAPPLGDPLVARLSARRSTRTFSSKPPTVESLKYVLWSMYGKTPRAITETVGTVPSAGGFYSLNIYIVVLKACHGLPVGQYVWDSREYLLKPLILDNPGHLEDDFRKALPVGLHGTTASCLLVLTSSIDQVARKYGCQALKFVYLEAGHCMQNAYLATAEAELSMVEVGQLNVSLVGTTLGLGDEEYFLTSALVGSSQA